jgi:hypothetical protein
MTKAMKKQKEKYPPIVYRTDLYLADGSPAKEWKVDGKIIKVKK